jgi:GrpB-like predicted nucleotidyltransferase (UPF0157 family)
MTTINKLLASKVEIVDYNPAWPKIYAAEREILLARTDPHFVRFEHVGSTAIPGQRAKPIIDMMVAINKLDELAAFQAALVELGYELFDVGMHERYFFRKQAANGQVFHLHIIELSSWAERHERLMRDYLLEHPEAVVAYGELKAGLAKTYAEDSLAYTEAKTTFIQDIVDRARDELGLARVNVWED